MLTLIVLVVILAEIAVIDFMAKKIRPSLFRKFYIVFCILLSLSYLYWSAWAFGSNAPLGGTKQPNPGFGVIGLMAACAVLYLIRYQSNQPNKALRLYFLGLILSVPTAVVSVMY